MCCVHQRFCVWIENETGETLEIKHDFTIKIVWNGEKLVEERKEGDFTL